MNVTVILCTHNGCRSLSKALDSAASSIMPAGVDWEVLVVDNNSTDQTREVVQQYCQRYPGRFRYLFEARSGKSYALNSGIQDAPGEILAFMDDDVTVEPTWLQNLTSSLKDGAWAGAGGRIILQWPSNLPNWLTIEGPCARHGFPGFDQGDTAKELDGPPFGTNMAFRREMFEKHGNFRIDLGPMPGSQIRGEDTEFGRRLVAEGERLRYEPSAVVYHPVPADRINKKYFLDWWYDNGRCLARYLHTQPLHLVCSLFIWTVRCFFTFEPRLRFYRRLVVYEKLGELTEHYRNRVRIRGSNDLTVAATKREHTA